MYKFLKRKNFFDKTVSDFGEVLDHIEAETVRLKSAGRTGYVEIVDTESGTIVSLTLPYAGDIVAYLEGEFDMEEIPETDTLEKSADEASENSTGWEQFTEDEEVPAAVETEESDVEGLAEETPPETNVVPGASSYVVTPPKQEPETSYSAEVLPEQSSNSFDLVSSSDVAKYGILSQKLVGVDNGKAEKLRSQLFNQIQSLEHHLVKEELEHLQKQLNQKQHIYESLLKNVKNSSDIDGLITTANELVELQLQYDKVSSGGD